MSMITNLTSSQKAQLEPYAQKWFKIGLSTEPCNVERSRYWIRKAYKVAGLTPPVKWVLCDSPLSCAQAQVEAHVKNPVGGQVEDLVWTQVLKQVRHQVCNQVWNQVYNQIEAQVRDQVWNQVYNQIEAQVRDQVWNQVCNQVRIQIGSQVVNQCCGAHDAAWLGYHDYFLKVLKLDCVKPLVPLVNLAKHCGWWVPYKDICFIQHRPTKIHMRNKLLHKDGDPAILFRDGFAVWSLNGVRVPQWLSETRTEDLDPRKLLKIDNAQVRAEFVRKVGIERVCHGLKAKCVDKRGSYELLMLDLQDGRNPRPYLKMLNPSVPNLWHIEGVHPDCVDVAGALKWRNGGIEEAPTVLT